jgi:hypothetical protein
MVKDEDDTSFRNVADHTATQRHIQGDRNTRVYVATVSFRDRFYGDASIRRKFLTNPTAVAVPSTESYWISPLNDIP